MPDVREPLCPPITLYKAEVRAIVDRAGICVDANRWRQIDELFHAAVACPAAERAAILDRNCPADPEFRHEVETLLAAHESASSGFIEFSPFDGAESSGDQLKHDPPIAAGRRIGRYTLSGVLGRGGAGIVYEARQDAPARIVALKVIRALPYSDELTPHLFRREGQALARLDHPGIATIYEAGSDDGYFYFAMERVEGAPLTNFAQVRELSVPDRLELFTRVCDAVHYAHQRGVIHRDLKPSNILVTQAGQPKVLDFGLARFLDSDDDSSRLTLTGSFQGTLAYTSPEQARGNGRDADVQSDAYSLGVILCELLTGELPYSVQGLALAEAARVICEREPPKTRFRSKSLRGDLGTILRKALQKPPKQRYTGAAALADDIHRFLDGRPILARPPTAGYYIRRLVARHWVVTSLLVLLLCSIIAFAVWMAVLYGRADRLRGVAEDEAAKAAQMQKFIQSIILSARPSRGQDLTMKQALDSAARRIDKELRDYPEVEAAVRLTIGYAYHELGRSDLAEPHFRAALALRERIAGDDPDAISECLRRLGQSLRGQQKYPEAAAVLDRAIELRRRSDIPDDLDLAKTLNSLALVYHRIGRLEDAEQLLRDAIEIDRRHPNGRGLHAMHLGNLGLVLRDPVEKEVVLLEALALAQSLNARMLTLTSLGGLASAARDRGDLAAAEAYARKHLDVALRTRGPAHPTHGNSLLRLSSVLHARGQLAEAEQYVCEALDVYEANPTTAPDRIAAACSRLAAIRRDLGDVGGLETFAARVNNQPHLTEGADAIDEDSDGQTESMDFPD